MKSRFLAAAALIGAAVILSLASFREVRSQQGFVGATQVPGFAAMSVNSTSFSPAVTAGAAGTVTNPASNFLIQVDGGPVFCSGGEDSIAESNITLNASTTYLIVYNCVSGAVYAKVGVTAPGTQSPDQPGVPPKLLFPLPNEVSLATVVCNATACGNGGGSITDSRTATNFPNGKQLSKIAFASLNASAPDGAMVICSSCTQPAAGSVACTSGAVAVLAARVAGAWRCF